MFPNSFNHQQQCFPCKYEPSQKDSFERGSAAHSESPVRFLAKFCVFPISQPQPIRVLAFMPLVAGTLLVDHPSPLQHPASDVHWAITQAMRAADSPQTRLDRAGLEPSSDRHQSSPS